MEEWERTLREARGESVDESATPPAPSPPSAEIERALRLQRMVNDRAAAVRFMEAGRALTKANPVDSPPLAEQLASRQASTGERVDYAPGAPPISWRTRAALEREILRRRPGAVATMAAESVIKRYENTPEESTVDLGAEWDKERAREDAAQEARRQEFQAAGEGNLSLPDPGDRSRPYSPEHNPLYYPVKGVETAFRAPRNLLQLPGTALHAATGWTYVPGVAPSFRLAEQEGRDPWTAYLAAMDPLGRFSPTGVRGKPFTSDDASYQDVVEKALPQLTPAGRVILGLPLDIANDPLSVTAFPERGAARLAGSKWLGTGLEAGAAAGSKLVGAGISKLRDASPVADDFFTFLRRAKVAASKATWDKYADLRDLGPAGDRAAAVLELGENSTRVQREARQRELEAILGRDVGFQRDVRDFIENPSSFSPPDIAPPGRVTAPPAAAPPPAGQLSLPPSPTAERVTSGPATMFGAEQAAPTAVPGTPDAARYGASPGWSQARDLPAGGAEAAEKVRALNQSLAEGMQERGLLGGARPNWFPHEMTRESLHDLGKRGGAGLGPAAWREMHASGYPQQQRRQLVDWINGLIDQENTETLAKGLREGRKVGEADLLKPVLDTTVDVNRFMAQTPEAIRKRIDRMGAGQLFREQAEFFTDKPAEVLKRAHNRGIKAVNDYDTMQNLVALEGPEGLPMAVGDVVEKNGRVYRKTPIERTVAEAPTGKPPLVTPSPADPSIRSIIPEPRPPIPQEQALGKPRTAAGAFEGTPAADFTLEEVPGYRVPRNKDFVEHFPGVALPKEVADHIDKMKEPYWRTEGFAGIFERYVLRPVGHTGQQFWKTAATVARPAFGFRNYYSQQIASLQEYGAEALAPWVQSSSHKLALPESYFQRHPEVLDRTIAINGQSYTYRELRDMAQHSGLWRNLRHGVDVKPMGADEAPLWSSKHPMSKLQDVWESRPVQAAQNLNPFSEKFAATQHVFAPMTEFFERQGRMQSMLLELERGKGLLDAAVSANKVNVNYGRFGKDFEKYVGAMYPFGKWTLAQAFQYPERVLRRPGPAQFPARLMDAGAHMAPEEERRRFNREPMGDMAAQLNAGLVGYPGVGALKEPEVPGGATGPYRLPYLAAPPEPSVTALNWWGAVPRVMSADDKAKAVGQEAVQGMFPVPKSLYERATGQNVWTGERIDPDEPVPAPRAIQWLWQNYPELRPHLAAQELVNPMRRDQSYLAVPRSTAWYWRALPNVQAMDLLLGAAGEGERPYDNRTAMILRSLGLTHVMHDPLRAGAEEARDQKLEAQRFEERVAKPWSIRAPKKKPEPR